MRVLAAPSRPPGSRPASFSSAQRSATPRAQKKICFLTAPPASAFSSTRAYIFSYSRGTDSAMRRPHLAAWLIGTGSNDSDVRDRRPGREEPVVAHPLEDVAAAAGSESATSLLDRNDIGAWPSTFEWMLSCVSITPFGSPVVPDV